MQSYLTEFSSVEAKTVLKYRLRMSSYSGNFKGGKPVHICPLCGEHDDEQSMIFKCQKVIDRIKNSSVYEDIVTAQQQPQPQQRNNLNCRWVETK